MMIYQYLAEKEVILASGSPRRKELLQDLLVKFKVETVPVDETFPAELKRESITEYLVKRKADAFRTLNDHELLITGDTIVWHQQQALNKPADKAEAIRMLESLSGQTHEVISSFAITTPHHQIIRSDKVEVQFKELSKEEIYFYIEHYQPYDKAGAYGIQEWIGKIGAKRISGSYYTVMGLAVHLLYEALLDLAKS